MNPKRGTRTALAAYVRGRDRVWEHAQKLGDVSEPDRQPEFGNLPAKPRFGVTVADRLDFRRGPAAWRDRSPRNET